MKQLDVHGCWDLAIAVGLQGNLHHKIMNTRNSLPCQESDPMPEDVYTYPCFITEDKSLLDVAASCETTMGEQGVDDCGALAELLGFDKTNHPIITNNRNGLPCVLSKFRPNDSMLFPCPKELTQPEGDDSSNFGSSLLDKSGDVCETSMKSQGVISCWDLADKVGLGGAQHTQIKNRKNDKACAESDPYPEDILFFVCPEAGASLATTGSSTTTVATAAAATAATATTDSSVHKIGDVGGDCFTTMAEQGVVGCWDLAEAVGMSGNDHPKILNTRNTLSCPESDPYPLDKMAFPCPEGEAGK